MIILKTIIISGIIAGLITYLHTHRLHSSVCHRCGGKGFVNGSICPDCGGSGDYVEGSDPRQKDVEKNCEKIDNEPDTPDDFQA